MNNRIDFTHDFQTSLERSHKVAEYPFWYSLYERFFSNMVAMQTYSEYGFWQQQGIDRGVILNTSKQILIDEKIRYRNAITGRVYSDIALEFWSNYERRAEGWICKPLMADYIAYLIAPLGVCYMLPVIQLQQAWAKYKDKWLSCYPTIKAKNQGYTSHSVALKPEVLFPAIGGQLRGGFEPFDI